MKKILLAALIGALALFAPRPAAAINCPVVHTYVTGETLIATNLNANETQWANCFLNLDYRNIGAAGIQAAQIIPASGAQATFGGSLVYTFPSGVTIRGGVFTGNGSGLTNITGGMISGGAPTFSGLVTAAGVTLSSGSFTGSGANLTGIPGSAITGGVVTSVSGTGNIASTGGSTPTISISDNPSFSGSLSASGGLTSGSGLNTGGPILGATTGSFSGALSAASVTATGLTVGNCVQVTTGGLFTTAAGACGTAQNFVDLTTAQTVAGAKTFTSATGFGFNGAPTCTGQAASYFTWNQSGGGGESAFTTCFNATVSASFWHYNGTATVQSSRINADGTYIAGPGAAAATGTSAYGPSSASVSGPLSSQQTAGGASGYVPPVYNASGAALASTTHMVTGNVSIAASSTVVITLSGAAVYTSGTSYFVAVSGNTNSMQVNKSNGSSFTITNPVAGPVVVDWITLGS